MTPSIENELMHYGVLGMRWGVRRNAAQLDKAAGRAERHQAKTDAKAKTAAKKSTNIAVRNMKRDGRSEIADRAHKQYENEVSRRDKKIMKARSKMSELNANVKAAKIVYNQATLDKGKREAYIALLKMKDVRLDNLAKAIDLTSHEKANLALLKLLTI